MSVEKSQGRTVNSHSNFSKFYNLPQKITENHLRKNDFSIPAVDICQAILWLVDKKRKEGKTGPIHESITPNELIKTANVNHQNVNSFVAKYEGKGLEVKRNFFKKSKIDSFLLTEKFEEYLRETFKVPVDYC